MPNPRQQFTRAPAGTKYVIESSGSFVRRYVEFPNGRKVQLPKRKALSYTFEGVRKIGVVPEHSDIKAHSRDA